MIARFPPFVALGALALACSSSSHSPAGAPIDGGAGASNGGTAGSGGNSVSGGGGANSGGTMVSRDGSVDARGPAPDATPGRTDAGTPGRFLWQVYYGRSFAAHVAIDSHGAAIVSGSFSDAKDVTLGRSTLTSHGKGDILFSRVLPDGAVDWARNYGGLDDDFPVTFALDGQDRIFLAGLYNGTGNIDGPDFQTFAGAAGRYDVSVAGLAPNGDYRWAKTINTTQEGFGATVALDRSGGVFVGGSFLGTAKIGGVDHVSAGGWDAFIARYDEPNGAPGPASTFGAAGNERALFALFTGTDVVVLGTFDGAMTLGTPTPTTLTSAGARDIFIAHASTSGVLTSAVAFGGPGDDVLEGADLDSSGNIVLAGEFNSSTLSVLGGKSLATAGGMDVFVAKLSPTFAPLWSERFGGDSDDFVRALAIGPGDVLAITGEFRNRLVIGGDVWNAERPPDAGPTSPIDAFVAKLDARGTPLWSHAAGGPASDRGLGVAIDQAGAVFMTASFQSEVDFGGNSTLTPDLGQFGSALVCYAP